MVTYQMAQGSLASLSASVTCIMATLNHLGGGESGVPPWPEREEKLRPSGPSHWLSRREALERWGEELFSVSFVPGSRWCEANLHAAWYLWRIPFPSVVSRRVEAFLLLNFDCVPGRCYFIPRLSPLTRQKKSTSQSCLA